ncbi:tRNA 2-thiouridine(34) synthase MnmA [Patescibacteria group bacterium]|nr:tRNA 2-thiouridine(34) synthase MnmA [Patescibacteria group bacterium]
MKNKKVAIAMSGGIDSSVTAALLKKQGCNCIGIFLKFWEDTSVPKKVENRCCSADSFQKAKRVASYLDFPLYTLNFKKDFKKQIVDDFLKQYKIGNTPNPCIRCNKFIKFDLLIKKARLLGCDYLATGHYVINGQRTRDKEQVLYRGKDKNKDQSYFLYNLNQNKLKQILFPLGSYTKTQVRSLAKKYKLPVSWDRESQEVCFVPEKRIESFLKRYLKLKTGNIVTTEKKVVGKHDGLALYTLGQRRGIKVGGIGPLYVVKKNKINNQLVVSKNINDKLLYKNEFKLKNINWVNEKPKENKIYDLVIRYQSKPIKCKIKNQKILLIKPAKLITPGQSAVIYEKNKLIGGGVIC